LFQAQVPAILDLPRDKQPSEVGNDVTLPALDREPLFYIEDGETPEGFPVLATYGEQGPQVAGWFARNEPHRAEGLHLLEALVRSPLALATLLEAAGPGAEEQVGRIRARRQWV
jgi:hypothetical protein